MTEADIPEVRDLERSAFTTTWQEEAFQNELKNNPTAHYLVMRTAEGKFAGYAGFWLVADEAHITSIAITAGLRGTGAGTRLLFSLLCLVRKLQARWATLEVREDNLAAQKLYKRFGFVRVGKRKQYYEGKVDGWILWAGNLQAELYRERLERLGAPWPEALREL